MSGEIIQTAEPKKEAEKYRKDGVPFEGTKLPKANTISTPADEAKVILNGFDEKLHRISDGKPEKVYLREIKDLVLSKEWADYLKGKDVNQSQSYEIRGRPEFEKFAQAVTSEYQTLSKKEDNSMPAEKLITLKQAFERAAPKAIYNFNNGNIYDVVVPDKEGIRRFQCGSGTRTLSLIARDLVQLNEGEQHVYVYTAGHVLPGIYSKNGDVVATEMTSEGGTLRFNVNKLDAKEQVRVTNAELDDIFAVLPDKTKTLFRSPIVFEQVTNPEEVVEKAGIIWGNKGVAIAQNDAGRSNPFAFGKALVPEGDLPRSKGGEASLEQYSRPHQQQQNNEKRTSSSEEITTFNKLLKQHSKELERKLSSEEFQAHSDYMKYYPKVAELYDQHADIMNDHSASAQIKVERLDAVLNKIDNYLKGNNVIDLYYKVDRILEDRGLKFMGNVHPLGLRDVVANNYNVMVVNQENDRK